MSDEDRRRWEERYAAGRGDSEMDRVGPPSLFEPYEDLFPTRGHALDVACGRGRTSVWLASRGLEVLGVDIAPSALAVARRLAEGAGVAGACRFEVADLDAGLPPGPPEDVIVCHMFRDERLDRPMVDRLAPDGILAVAVRSEVGAGPGRFQATAGELRRAFAGLSVLAGGEGDGRAWLLARK